MTRNRNNANKQVLGVNPMSNKSKKQKLKEKRNVMIKKDAGNQDCKEYKVVQVIKKENESDGNKSDSMKKNVKQTNSPIKHENKKNNNKLKKENAKQNMNKNSQKKIWKGEENSSVFSKPKNIHKMKEEVNTVACPKDIQLQMSHRQFDRNDCTLFVRFGRETGLQDRQILIKTFADKVKEIRDHKKYKNCNYVEFESREQLEEMKSQIEQMKTAGDKPFVDYMGDKGKINKPNEEMKINPKKLFISNLPKGTTPLQIKLLFQKCSKVTIPKKGKSYGFIFFNDECDAKEGFESAQNLKIGGSDVLVVYSCQDSKVKTSEIKSDKKRPLSQDNDKENKVNESPSKKQKITKDEKDHEQEEKDQEKATSVIKESSKGCETKANNTQEDMDEIEDLKEGDDKDSEESEIDDGNDNEEVKNDDDDEEDDDDDDDDDDNEDDDDSEDDDNDEGDDNDEDDDEDDDDDDDDE